MPTTSGAKRRRACARAIRRQWALNQTTGGHTPSPPSSPHHPTGIPLPLQMDDERRAHLRADLDAHYACLYGLTRDEPRYILDPADVYGPDFPAKRSASSRKRKSSSTASTARSASSRCLGIGRTANRARGADFSNQGQLSAISRQPLSPSIIRRAAPQQSRNRPKRSRSYYAGAKPAPKRQSCQAPLADPTIATSGSFGEQVKTHGRACQAIDCRRPSSWSPFYKTKQNAISLDGHTTALQTRGGEDTTVAAALAAFLRDHPDHPSCKDAVNVLQHRQQSHETDRHEGSGKPFDLNMNISNRSMNRDH